jgi:ATP/maltotriose-dependent transcriptional regulator MalT
LSNYRYPSLTTRERQVLQLAADGRGLDEIAATLAIAHGTVKTHFGRTYAKLGVRDRASAVAQGIRLGLIR